MWRQPKAVWAVAFACVIAFMGIGLVDPILKPIADKLDATPSQVSLLFTSYMAVMGVAMLVTGVVSSRIGAKRTLLLGLVLIIVGAGLAGMSDTVGGIVGFRAGWGLGNALFIATALATIVNAATRLGRRRRSSCTRPRSGLGIAAGPLVGGLLGSISWRGPFFGVSALMAIALVATAFLLPTTPRAERATSLADPFRALRHRGLLGVAITALLYNFGFFTLLAFTPFPLDMSAAPDRADLLRLGPAAGVHLGGRRAAAAAPLRHRAVAAGRPAGVRRRPRGDGGRAPTTRPCWPSCVVVVGRVPRHQQHPDHRDRDEGRAGRARRRLGGVQLRALLRRRRRARGWPASSARRSACTCRSGSAPPPSPWPCACSRAADASSPTSTPSRATAPRASHDATEAEAVTVGDA